MSLILNLFIKTREKKNFSGTFKSCEIKMPKEFVEFDLNKEPGESWGLRIGGGVDRGKVLVVEKVSCVFLPNARKIFFSEIPFSTGTLRLPCLH